MPKALLLLEHLLGGLGTFGRLHLLLITVKSLLDVALTCSFVELIAKNSVKLLSYQLARRLL